MSATGDVRCLHEAAVSNRDACLSMEMFCMSVRKQVAAMAAVLGGLDMLVLTGRFGENDAQVRNDICSGVSWIGVSLDESRCASACNPVRHGASRCQTLASQEDKQIARHTWVALL